MITKSRWDLRTPRNGILTMLDILFRTTRQNLRSKYHLVWVVGAYEWFSPFWGGGITTHFDKKIQNEIGWVPVTFGIFFGSVW